MPRLSPAAGPASPPFRTPAKAPRAPDRPTRRRLLWRRQRRLIRPILTGLILLALLAAGAAFLRSVQPGATVATWRERLGNTIGLPVKQVIIEGREKTPEPLLRAALGVSPGDKLLGVSLDAARTRIEQLAWVHSATIERRLSGTIIVTLQERRPYAVWQSQGKFILIDRQGQPVADQDPAKDANAFATLPLVVGPGAPDAATALLDTIATIPELKSRVVAAIRVGERRWNLRLHSGADILLPEGAETAAITKLMELQSTQNLLDRPLQTVDMRLGDRLTIRAAPEPRFDPKPGPPSTTPRRPT